VKLEVCQESQILYEIHRCKDGEVDTIVTSHMHCWGKAMPLCLRVSAKD